MPWMLKLRSGWLIPAVFTIGCYGGTMGPGTTSRTVPPARAGTEGRPPIASQSLTSTASIRVLPFATLPPYASVAQPAGVRPLAMLASNNANIDGRSMPYLNQSSGAHSASLAPGLPPSPQEDLRYRGGRTIRDLTWVNIYVGGQAAWDVQDWRNVDKFLNAAMCDEQLNNVIRQYFNNQPLKNTFRGSYFLSAWKPQVATKADLERQVSGLYSSGSFQSMDLPNTVINFMLPRGTVLGDPNVGATDAPAGSGIPNSEDSTGGLGGYHGSVHVNGATVYYTVGVYSERLSSGTNGIPVFDQNWKNIVATFYHQLQEARTDPDVGDAVAGLGPDPSRWLGWTSDTGNEIGDYPIAAAQQLSLVLREVPLADGTGAVPIQLQYSNAVHGPEGPIAYPHGMEPPGSSTPSQPPVTNPPTNGTPPISDPELAKLVEGWSQLEDFVRKAIVRLANSR